MADDLLVTYRAERLRLNATATRATVAAWDRLIQEPEEAITETLRLVNAAQARTAVMVDAYMTARRRKARVGSGSPGGDIDPERYTVGRLRRAPEREVYGRPFGALAGQLSQGAPFAAAAASGRASVARLALTDMQLAQTHSARDWMSADNRIYGYERVLGGGESCPLCVSASQRIYYRDDLAAIHERCVSGDTLVSVLPAHGGAAGGRFAGGHGAIREVTRRWYRGEGVLVRTAAGHELAVTPNHPILTTRGWVPAGLLNEGDHLFSRGLGERIVGGVPHEDQVPARIEDRFAAGRVRGLVRVPLAAEHFHGDGEDTEVDVVAAHRLLDDRLLTAFNEPSMQQPLAVGAEAGIALAGERSEGELIFAGGLASHGGVSAGGDRFALAGGQGAHPRSVGFASSTPLHPGLIQDPDHDRTAHAQGLCHLHRGLPGEIAGDDFGARHFYPPRAWAPDERDALAVQRPADGLLADADGGRRLADGLAGLVEADRLTELRRLDWSAGHWVYNLHTENGHYNANGIVTHNCQCSVSPLWGEHPGGLSVPRDATRVVDDPEIGPRLMAEDWAA